MHQKIVGLLVEIGCAVYSHMAKMYNFCILVGTYTLNLFFPCIKNLNPALKLERTSLTKQTSQFIPPQKPAPPYTLLYTAVRYNLTGNVCTHTAPRRSLSRATLPCARVLLRFASQVRSAVERQPVGSVEKLPLKDNLLEKEKKSASRAERCLRALWLCAYRVVTLHSPTARTKLTHIVSHSIIPSESGGLIVLKVWLNSVHL